MVIITKERLLYFKVMGLYSEITQSLGIWIALLYG